MVNGPGGAGMVDGQWQLEVDGARCMGTGMCVGARPDRFALDGGRSHPVQPWAEPDDELLDVAAMCPTEAITVRAADGTVLAPEE
jgi:ferredoxin